MRLGDRELLSGTAELDTRTGSASLDGSSVIDVVEIRHGAAGGVAERAFPGVAQHDGERDGADGGALGGRSLTAMAG